MREINGINYERDIESMKGKSKFEILNPKFPIELNGLICGVVLGNCHWDEIHRQIVVYFPSPKYHKNYFDLVEAEIGRLNRRPKLMKHERTFEGLGQPEFMGYYNITKLPTILSDIIIKYLGVDPETIKAESKRVPKCFIENPKSDFTRKGLRILNDFRTHIDPKRSRVQIYSPTPEFAQGITGILKDLGYESGIYKRSQREFRARRIRLYGQDARDYMEKIGYSRLMS